MVNAVKFKFGKAIGHKGKIQCPYCEFGQYPIGVAGDVVPCWVCGNHYLMPCDGKYKSVQQAVRGQGNETSNQM